MHELEEHRRESERLLTIPEVADYLAVSTATVYRLLAGGELPCKRIRGATRFTWDDIDELLTSAAAEGDES